MNVVQVGFKQGCLKKSHFDDVTLLDPVVVDPAHYTLAFENDCARVLRAKFGPHELAPLHRHIRSRVVIYLTDQKTRVTGANGNVNVTTRRAGEVSWGIPAKHTEENLWPTPFEAVVVEP